MIYKAVEVIWIFFADGPTNLRTEVFQEVLADLKTSTMKFLSSREPFNPLAQIQIHKYSLLHSFFIAFSEREPFLRGFPVWSLWSLWFPSCIWVSRKCAKSFVRFRPLVWICVATQIWRLLQIGLWIALWWNGATASIQW